MRTIFLLSLLLLTFVGCAESPDESTSALAERAPAAATTPPPATPSAIVKLNLNTATEEQFLEIPEVGAKMAHEFEEYRPYASIRQFRKEIGKYVDEAQVARYEKYVYVPIAMNDCDAETLQQIPGVSASVAEAIIAGGPYADADAMLAKLEGLVKPDSLKIARSYLAE
jgi:DNA uptake protein ComE-like DNA-binding protein